MELRENVPPGIYSDWSQIIVYFSTEDVSSQCQRYDFSALRRCARDLNSSTKHSVRFELVVILSVKRVQRIGEVGVAHREKRRYLRAQF